ncbi:Modification methylase HhaI [Aliarcobacter thereius]|uniref:Cytosine-specific methyltransferase n=1 Tax=Aliarcobacter thereius TaxID=544718 RepID=A0A1C0B7J8_9BACT|nr:DNA (cytosine-5-)-methyltransferase [Aliarcobacter thereius]OCL99557.1 Modification methylase HhaI [Aliarcobacter thereius]
MSANLNLNTKLSVATAFSGGLAAVEFALKYENIKHEIIFACEFDKYARQQYLKFHNEPKTFYKDIRDLKAVKYLNQIDLFVWGSPCQNLSLAGNRKGLVGDKSSLFFEGARVQSEMKPKMFIFENVKGLLSSNSGADYKEVCDTFRNQAYHIITLQMNTKDYGVPQNRERIFIVGFLDVNRYHSYTEPAPFKLEKRLKDILEKDVDEKYHLSEKMVRGFIKKENFFCGNFKIKDINTEIANCINTVEGNRRTDNYIKVGYINQDAQAGQVFSSLGISPTLSAGSKGYSQGYVEDIKLEQVGILNIKGHECTKRIYSDNGISPSLVTKSGGNTIPKIQIKSNIRRLTPKECFRLQGLKDEDINIIVSDTQAYKIAGNAISVNVMQYLLKSIFERSEIKTSIFDFVDIA